MTLSHLNDKTNYCEFYCESIDPGRSRRALNQISDVPDSAELALVQSSHIIHTTTALLFWKNDKMSHEVCTVELKILTITYTVEAYTVYALSWTALSQT